MRFFLFFCFFSGSKPLSQCISARAERAAPHHPGNLHNLLRQLCQVYKHANISTHDTTDKLKKTKLKSNIIRDCRPSLLIPLDHYPPFCKETFICSLDYLCYYFLLCDLDLCVCSSSKVDKKPQHYFNGGIFIPCFLKL